jgi:hypothetical protein
VGRSSANRPLDLSGYLAEDGAFNHFYSANGDCPLLRSRNIQGVAHLPSN